MASGCPVEAASVRVWARPFAAVLADSTSGKLLGNTIYAPRPKGKSYETFGVRWERPAVRGRRQRVGADELSRRRIGRDIRRLCDADRSRDIRDRSSYDGGRGGRAPTRGRTGAGVVGHSGRRAAALPWPEQAREREERVWVPRLRAPVPRLHAGHPPRGGRDQLARHGRHRDVDACSRGSPSSTR